MKITLNIPDNMQLDLIKLGSKLEVPVEKVVVTVMGAGTAVLEKNPQLITAYKEMWAKEAKRRI